jgi:DNA polymerase-3 subunit epsilon
MDTLVLARRKHPGRHNTLDDLCARYGVDRPRRIQHGALVDGFEPI